MQINDLNLRIEKYKNQINKAFERVMNNGWLVLGPEVERFEQSFANYLDAKYCVGVANGTDAIELALRALNISQGDSVATVANAGMYTTTALLAIGANPFYIDVDLDTRNTTLIEVEKAINAGVNAIVITHLYGVAVDEIVEIAELCKKNNIPLIEDCAQAHGAKINGQCVGTFGNAASFSFYPTKNLGALGDGGAIVTNDLGIAHKLQSLRKYGWQGKYQVELLGGRNSRLDELQAAFLSEFLVDLDNINCRRRKIAHEYSIKISHPDILLPLYKEEEDVGHLYVIRTSNRCSLQAHLKKYNIGSDIHYPIPDYKQSILSKKFINLKLEATEILSQQILTIPCYPEMKDADVNKVIRIINEWII